MNLGKSVTSDIHTRGYITVLLVVSLSCFLFLCSEWTSLLFNECCDLLFYTILHPQEIASDTCFKMLVPRSMVAQSPKRLVWDPVYQSDEQLVRSVEALIQLTASARTHSDVLFGRGIGKSGLVIFCGNMEGVRDASGEDESVPRGLPTSTVYASLDTATCLEWVLGGGGRTAVTGGSLGGGSGFAKGSSTPRRIRYWRAQVGRLGSAD